MAENDGENLTRILTYDYRDPFYGETDDDEETEPVAEYDIAQSPRDLTPKDIEDLIDSRLIEIPYFQRNYIWDRKRASRLIESIILGLPIPEVFLYLEDDENSRYKVIDGQQRLLSIYFFMKGRFPRKSAPRAEIGRVVAGGRKDLLDDDRLFGDFSLDLKGKYDVSESPYNKKKYSDFDNDTRVKFTLRRYIRTLVIRQVGPDDGGSSMFEIFNRLNTGGIALNAQEIRASLYYCPFYRAMAEMNEEKAWRDLLGKQNVDIHCADIEVMLRAIALMADGKNYSTNMTAFLNCFSRKATDFEGDQIKYVRDLFMSFVAACSCLGKNPFERNGRFSKTLFESLFAALCGGLYEEGSGGLLETEIDGDKFRALKDNEKFLDTLKANALSVKSVKDRIQIARDVMGVGR